MGRHSKFSSRFIRRGTVLAVGVSMPTGLCAAHMAPGVIAAAPPVGVPPPLPDRPERSHTPPPQQQWVLLKVALREPEPPRQAAVDESGTDSARPTSVPPIAMAAYLHAERRLALESPQCGLAWSLLAGIGKVESDHAFGGAADSAGNPVNPIYGPTLDGSLSGNNVVLDTDGGALDGLTDYDRAVGPMQFLPQTWNEFAADGNGDGIEDPQNLFDATIAAGRYLCSGGSSLTDPDQRTKAILRYNNSMAYVVTVMGWADKYRSESDSETRTPASPDAGTGLD